MAEQKERKLRIIRYAEVPATTPERFGQTDVVLTVMLEDGSTEIIQIPKEELTDEKVVEAVQEKIAEREKWQGKELSY